MFSSPEICVSQFSCSVVSNSLRPHGLQHTRLPCPSPIPRACSNSWFHWVMMPSNHLILFCPLLLLPSIFPSIRVSPVSQLFASGGQSLGALALASVLPVKIWGWFPLGLTGLISLQSKRLFKSLLQHHNSKASILWWFLSVVHLWHPYMTTGKPIALTIWTFVGNVMSLFFNMLLRLVTAFLPRNKCLFISWLQSASTVILEPPQNKVCHCFPIYILWSDGTRCHDLSFLNVEF